MDDGSSGPTDRLRTEAVTLAARIRIALPYRRASKADIAELEAALERLRAVSLGADDEAVAELTNLRDTLEILII